jgi:hypothetical protein
VAARDGLKYGRQTAFTKAKIREHHSQDNQIFTTIITDILNITYDLRL